jgi:hypothetical protein
MYGVKHSRSGDGKMTHVLRVGDGVYNVGHMSKELEQRGTLLGFEESFILFNMISNFQKVLFVLVNARLEDVERVVVDDCTDFDEVLL